MSDKLTKAQREQIIFNHLKGNPDPLYEVSQTKYGKYIVKPKKIEVEEEEVNESEPEEEQEKEVVKQQVQQAKSSNDAKRERRKRNRRAKQDAKRILDALTNLINSNNGPDSSDDDDGQQHYTPQLYDPSNYDQQPQPVVYRRRRLVF